MVNEHRSVAPILLIVLLDRRASMRFVVRQLETSTRALVAVFLLFQRVQREEFVEVFNAQRQTIVVNVSMVGRRGCAQITPAKRDTRVTETTAVPRVLRVVLHSALASTVFVPTGTHVRQETFVVNRKISEDERTMVKTRSREICE
uniref:Uncharacterized protein n=1 Tax=Caenorhabditis japonica TaxID=281687 RepID=A0A8R1HGI0_CAEJA